MTIPDLEGRYGPNSPVSSVDSHYSADDERILDDSRLFKDQDPWANDVVDYHAEGRSSTLWMQAACNGSDTCRCYKCESFASSHEINMWEDKGKKTMDDPIIDICLSPENFTTSRRLRPSPCDTFSNNVFSMLEWLVPGGKGKNNVRVRL